MSCKTLRVVHTPSCLSCVVMTLKKHTDAVYKTYIQFVRVIKYSLRTRREIVKGIEYSLGNIYTSQKEHYIEDLVLNNNNSGQPGKQGRMRGCGVVT